jgi:tetratricopeptide (TPR) repeat protein
VAQCLRWLGEAQYSQKDHEAARTTLTEVGGAIGHRPGIAPCIHSLGDICRQEKKYDEAISFLRAARELYRVIGDKYGLGWSCFSMAQVFGELGDAREMCLEALDILRSHGLEGDIGMC